MGHFWEGDGSSIWVEKLVWKAFIGCVKFSPLVSDVDNWEGVKCKDFLGEDYFGGSYVGCFCYFAV
jgi:hypothetical protein